jgi:hypothetical protein
LPPSRLIYSLKSCPDDLATITDSRLRKRLLALNVLLARRLNIWNVRYWSKRDRLMFLLDVNDRVLRVTGFSSANLF